MTLQSVIAARINLMLFPFKFQLGAALGEVLSFVTGSDEIPPLGFNPQPMIKFWEDVRPKANTCGNTLYLPLFPSHTTNTIAYEAFKENMDDGILNSPSFGLA